MKSMLIAATLVGAAIAGMVLYKRNSGNINAKELRNKARKLLLSGNGHAKRNSIQTMG